MAAETLQLRFSALNQVRFGRTVSASKTATSHMLTVVVHTRGQKSNPKNDYFWRHLNNMKTADLKFNLIDSYLGLLNNLSPDNKLELISKLSDSLKGSRKPTKKSLSNLYGAFISKKSAEEILTELKNSRTFIRKTEQL